MKILYFNDFRLGVLKGDNSVVDVTAVVQDIPHVGPGDLMNGLIERFSSYRQKLEQAVAQGQGVPLASVRIRPPLPKPTTIDCMAVNYMEDGTRSAPAPSNSQAQASATTNARLPSTTARSCRSAPKNQSAVIATL